MPEEIYARDYDAALDIVNLGPPQTTCQRCYPYLGGAKALCREHTLEEALRPFVEACKRYEEGHGDFAKAFHSVSVADIRRAAAIELPTA